MPPITKYKSLGKNPVPFRAYRREPDRLYPTPSYTDKLKRLLNPYEGHWVKQAALQTLIDQPKVGSEFAKYQQGNDLISRTKERQLNGYDYTEGLAEAVKIPAGAVGDFVVNAAQEGLHSMADFEDSRKYFKTGPVPTKDNTMVKPTLTKKRTGGKLRDRYFTGEPMPNDPSSDAISKVLLQRNLDKNFIQRTINPEKYPKMQTNTIPGYEHENPRNTSTLLMSSSDNISYPQIIQNPDGRLQFSPNQTSDYVVTPTNKLADYFSTKGLKRASNDMYKTKYDDGGSLHGELGGNGISLTGVPGSSPYTYSSGRQTDWVGINRDAYEDDDDSKKLTRDDVQSIAQAAGVAGRALDRTRFNDWRDDTDNVTEGAMSVVGKAGVVGGIIAGAYNVINPIAKGVRAKAEKTDAFGNMVNPKAAGRAAVIGAQLDPIQAITTRMKLGYWGGNPKKYAELVQKKMHEDFNEKQKPYVDANRLYAQGRAAQQGDFEQGQKYAQYYENGGSLSGSYFKAGGGQLKQLSKSAVEVQGPSHEGGGVQLPQVGAEVEGNETISNGYVFSDKLGFAKEHKKLATAMGKVEQKPATRERLNTLKLLKEKENKLQLTQEYLRKTLNLQ